MCFSHSISSHDFKFLIPSDLKLGLKAVEYSYNLNYNEYAQLSWVQTVCSK